MSSSEIMGKSGSALSEDNKRKKRRPISRILLVIFLFFFCGLIFLFVRDVCVSPSDPYQIPTGFVQEASLLDHPLRHYYIDFSDSKYLYMRNNPEIPYDGKGIPLHRIFDYHPVFISQYALGAYEYYLKTEDKAARQSLLACADWLADNLKEYNGLFFWEYTQDFKYGEDTLKAPWFSAMVQGEGASVLLRAYYETNKEIYLQAAKKAIEPILVSMEEGGVSDVKGDHVFPQEYPATPPSDVLNGSIFAFMGVYEYYRATGDPRIKQYCDKIIDTYLNVIDDYDTGYWSLYGRRPKYAVATAKYHTLHIAQLKALYLLTGEEKFNKYALLFETYQNNWVKRTLFTLATYRKRIMSIDLEDIEKIPTAIKTLIHQGTYP
jgi:hypothetical protein